MVARGHPRARAPNTIISMNFVMTLTGKTIAPECNGMNVFYHVPRAARPAPAGVPGVDAPVRSFRIRIGGDRRIRGRPTLVCKVLDPDQDRTMDA